jgi:hypothetical protein
MKYGLTNLRLYYAAEWRAAPQAPANTPATGLRELVAPQKKDSASDKELLNLMLTQLESHSQVGLLVPNLPLTTNMLFEKSFDKGY